MPQLVGDDALEALGELGGRTWYAWKGKDTELEPDTLYAPNFAGQPNAPMRREYVDDELFHRTFRMHAPGTFAARSSYVPKPLPVPKPLAPVDALAGSDVLNRTGAAAFGPGRPALRIRGAAAILERLEAKGTRVVLNASRDGLVMLSSGGRPPAFHVATIQAAAPLVLPYLRDGVPPSCQVSAHDAEAVTVAEPGVRWCGECLP